VFNAKVKNSDVQEFFGVRRTTDFCPTSNLDTAGFDCPSIISGKLSAVPGVGAVIAQVFDLACSA
jgi:hypothetical protein